MDASNDDGDRSRLARVLAAAGLAIVAIASFRKGKRVTGTAAALGAAGVAYGATTESGAEIDVTSHEVAPDEGPVRVCAICGDPIRTGQARRPDENDDVAHETCLEAAN